MNSKSLLVSLVVIIVVIAIGGYVFPKVVQLPLGASAGPEVFTHTSFRSGVTEGGFITATSSIGTATYLASHFVDNSGDTASLIQHTAASALTATLPASSTLQAFVPNTGDTKTVFITAITTGITLAGGTGTDLNTASSTKFIVVGSVGRLDFVRKSNTDIEVLLTPSSGN